MNITALSKILQKCDRPRLKVCNRYLSTSELCEFYRISPPRYHQIQARAKRKLSRTSHLARQWQQRLEITDDMLKSYYSRRAESFKCPEFDKWAKSLRRVQRRL